MRAVPLSRYIVFFALVAGGCAADLLTKRWVFDWLGMPGWDSHTWWLWTDVIGVQTSLNEGALFGMGQGRVLVFVLLSLAAIVAILWWMFRTGAARDWSLTVAMGCVMAGILGNLYDRVGLPGLTWNYANVYHEIGQPVYAVRDWVLVMIGRWPWPNFNIADSLLVCGVAVLLWHIYRSPATDALEKPA